MSHDSRLTDRPASPADEEFVFRLYASTRADEMAAWGWAPEQQEKFLQFQFRARSLSFDSAYPGAAHSILLAAEQPAGAAIVSRTDFEIRLVDVALLPEFRNRGLGSEWISRLIEEAAESGIPLRLNVVQGNRAARLYQRLGFVAKSDGGVYVEMEYDAV